MYDGREDNVTLRCRHSLMDQVIDKFGPDIEVKRIRDKTFDVTVPVKVTGTFYAWVTQYVGEMTIAAPDYIRTAYAEYLQDAIDDVLGVK